MKGYPRPFQSALYIVLILLVVSGLLLAPTFVDLYLEMDVPWRASGQQRLWIALCHTAAGFVTLMFFGALWSVHMRAGIRRRRHLLSGMTVILAGLLLAVSSLGIFYAGNEELSWWSSTSHVVLGLVAVPGFLVHRLSAWRGARRQHQASPASSRAAHTPVAPAQHSAGY